MIKQQLARFNRLELLGAPTALEKLERLSTWAGRDIYVKRDDTTTLALGGNKVRKLEYLAADALAQGADTLITAGGLQSNHARQTAALAARLGLGCVVLLENPLATNDPNYLHNGNRLLLDLFDAKVELVENLDNADDQLNALAARLRNAGKKPYLVPIGGSSPIGALGYVRAGLELAEQIQQTGLNFAAVVLASGSAGTHSGLALGLSDALPNLPVVGVTVSRSDEAQRPKVQGLAERTAELSCGMNTSRPVTERLTPARCRQSSWWRVKKVCCSIRYTPARPWRACSMVSVAIASMTARSFSCTPGALLRCSLIPTSFRADT
jgi:D-cysteine desulfhydrase